jgi:hypothetical protein
MKVKILVNEVEQVIPGCGEIYCPYKTFKRIYSDALQCPYVHMCHGGNVPEFWVEDVDFICPAADPHSD